VKVAATAIALETALAALTELEKAGLSGVEAVQLSAARVEKKAEMHMLLGQNPIFIISGGGK
jgi:precorrin-6Y C5,15-methyltransferase (decarboxylating)